MKPECGLVPGSRLHALAAVLDADVLDDGDVLPVEREEAVRAERRAHLLLVVLGGHSIGFFDLESAPLLASKTAREDTGQGVLQ